MQTFQPPSSSTFEPLLEQSHGMRNIRQYEPNQPVYARRFTTSQWESVRPFIESLHNRGLPRSVIRRHLLSEHNFRPTDSQLATRMNSWGLSSRAAMVYRPRPSQVFLPITDTSTHRSNRELLPGELANHINALGDLIEHDEPGLLGNTLDLEGVGGIAAGLPHAPSSIEQPVLGSYDPLRHAFPASIETLRMQLGLGHISSTSGERTEQLIQILHTLRAYPIFLSDMVYLFLSERCFLEWLRGHYLSYTNIEQIALELQQRKTNMASTTRDAHPHLLWCHCLPSSTVDSSHFSQQRQRSLSAMDHIVLLSTGSSTDVPLGGQHVVNPRVTHVINLLLVWCENEIDGFKNVIDERCFEESVRSLSIIQYYDSRLTRYLLRAWIDYARSFDNLRSNSSENVESHDVSALFREDYLFEITTRALVLISRLAVKKAGKFVTKTMETRDHYDAIDVIVKGMTKILKKAICELRSDKPRVLRNCCQDLMISDSDVKENLPYGAIDLMNVLVEEFTELEQRPFSHRHQDAHAHLAYRPKPRSANDGSTGLDSTLHEIESTSSSSLFRRGGYKLKNAYGPPSSDGRDSTYTKDTDGTLNSQKALIELFPSYDMFGA